MTDFPLPELHKKVNGGPMRKNRDWRFIKAAIPNISKSEYAFLRRAYSDGAGSYRKESKRFEKLNTIICNHLENEASE